MPMRSPGGFGASGTWLEAGVTVVYIVIITKGGNGNGVEGRRGATELNDEAAGS